MNPITGILLLTAINLLLLLWILSVVIDIKYKDIKKDKDDKMV
jgi:hypothetical protein